MANEMKVGDRVAVAFEGVYTPSFVLRRGNVTEVRVDGLCVVRLDDGRVVEVDARDMFRVVPEPAPAPTTLVLCPHGNAGPGSTPDMLERHPCSRCEADRATIPLAECELCGGGPVTEADDRRSSGMHERVCGVCLERARAREVRTACPECGGDACSDCAVPSGACSLCGGQGKRISGDGPCHAGPYTDPEPDLETDDGYALARFEELLIDALHHADHEELPGPVRVTTFEEAGVLTNDVGLVVEVGGRVFHVTIQEGR